MVSTAGMGCSQRVISGERPVMESISQEIHRYA